MDIVTELVSMGISPEDAAQLATRLEQAPAGLLDVEDGRPATLAQLALQVCVVAAREVFAFTESLRRLLDWLEDAQLSNYEAARASHVRGILAWRGDNLPFDATRALNHSLKLLSSDSSARAARYRARVHDTFGQLLHQQGMISDALREFQAALRLRDHDTDKLGAAITLGNLGRLHLEGGDYAAAADYLARDLAIVEELAPAQLGVRAQLLSHLAECHLQLGAVGEAETFYARSAELASESANMAAWCFARIGTGRVHASRGEAGVALQIGSEVFARVESMTLGAEVSASLRAATHLLQADALLQSRRHDEAIARFQDALAQLGRAVSSSPMEYARAYRGLSAALAAKQQYGESARSLRFALRHLDGTAAEALRLEVEQELQETSRDSWLLHAAGRFLGQQQIEHLLGEAGRFGFRGSKRNVAVLFSDLRGFTTLSEQLAPEELVALLNDYLTHMTRCIDQHQGVVDKFIGDAVMGVFPLDEHNGALAAATAMQEELERFNRYAAERRQELSMGIGIHGGTVVSGLIGSPQKREVTVIGDVVNTASRIEGMTKKLGAKILVSGEAIGQHERATYLLRPLGRYAPRGRRQCVELFDVLGLRDRGATSRRIDEEIARASAALRAFEARAFEQAEAHFDALAGETRTAARARGYELLASKARALRAVPPPADWAGDISLAD